MTNIKQYPKKHAFALNIAEMMFKEKNHFDMHLPFVILAFLLQVYCLYYSFTSEYQFIFNNLVNIGAYREQITYFLCFLIEITKFMLMGLIISLFRLQKFSFFYGFALFTLLLSSASWYMSIGGTNGLAINDLGQAPENKTVSIYSGIYQPQIADLKNGIAEQNAIITKNKNWQPDKWAKYNRFTKAKAKKEILETRKALLEDKFNAALENGNLAHNKAMTEYNLALEEKTNVFKHKVIFTETAAYLLSIYISYVFFTLLSNGEGIEGIHKHFGTPKKEKQETDETTESKNEILNDEPMDIQQQDAPKLSENLRNSPKPKITTKKETWKETKKDTVMKLCYLGMPKEHILIKADVTPGYFTEIMQEAVVNYAKEKKIDLRDPQEFSYLINIHHLTKEGIPEKLKLLQKNMLLKKGAKPAKVGFDIPEVTPNKETLKELTELERPENDGQKVIFKQGSLFD